MYHGPGVSDSEGTQEYVGSDRSDPASPYLSMGPESSDSDATQEFVDGDLRDSGPTTYDTDRPHTDRPHMIQTDHI